MYLNKCFNNFTEKISRSNEFLIGFNIMYDQKVHDGRFKKCYSLRAKRIKINLSIIREKGHGTSVRYNYNLSNLIIMIFVVLEKQSYC